MTERFEERPDVVEAAMRFRQERARKGAQADAEGREHGSNGQADVEMPELVTGAVLAAEAPTERLFLDTRTKMLPMQQVVLLQGDGGVGKSLLAMQLALAVATATPWIGTEVASGPVIYVSAEDDRRELGRRQREIAEGEQIDASQAWSLNYLPMAGRDATLAFETKSGQLEKTRFFRQLRLALEMTLPALLVLDNLADVFAGNENNRGLAKRFVGILRALAMEFDCVVLLLGHPSLSGLNSGSGTSGSTAWSNSARARLYLHRPEGPDEDDHIRVLEIMKANYGPSGGRISLRWEDGRFIAQVLAKPFDNVTTADLDRVQEQFRSGLWRVNEQSQDWGGYAVGEVLDIDLGRHVSGKDNRTTEQNRNRETVRAILGTWVRNKAVFIVKGIGPDRKPTSFFSSRPEEEQ